MKADNDNKRIWRDIDISGLPISGSQAKAIGATYFFTGKACIRGHISPRFTGGGCIDCYFAKPASHPWSEKLTWGKTLNKIARAAARHRGDTHYVPPRPCKHGHRLRWVSTNNCVTCDAELRDERREIVRDAYLLKKYGITQAERDEMAAAQGWKCPICEGPLDGKLAMHIDHCHASGELRGILCSRCNQSLGLLQDDPAIIRRAADYLEQRRRAA